MSWVTPKTWWNRLNGDHINYTDVNRIKNNVQAIYDDLVVWRGQVIEQTTPEQPYFRVNIDAEYAAWGYFTYDLTVTGNDNRTYHNVYYVHGVGEHRLCTDCPFITEGNCAIEGTYVITLGGYPFTIQPMFEDKAVNDLWYADEINTVLDNLETIAEHTSNLTFNGRPYYGDNSPVPTDTELNIIESFTLNLYNRIYRDVPGINLGTEGSIGEPITNRLI